MTTSIASGLYAARPGSPSAGEFYFATDRYPGTMIVWDGTQWLGSQGATRLADGAAADIAWDMTTLDGFGKVPNTGTGAVGLTLTLGSEIRERPSAFGTARFVNDTSSSNGAMTSDTSDDGPATGDVTFEGWVQFLQTPADADYDILTRDSTLEIADHVAGGEHLPIAALNIAGGPGVVTVGGSGAAVIAALGEGAWHHIALVLDTVAAELRIYADGAYVDTGAAVGATGVDWQAFPFIFGYTAASGNQAARAAVVGWRVWATALAEGELADIYLRGIG